MLQEIGQWIGGILGTATATALLVLATRAWQWLSAKLSQEQQEMLSQAAHKVLVLGFTKLIPLIESEGWNSPAVRDAVVDFGLDEIKKKFPDAFNYVEKFAGKVDAKNPFGTTVTGATAERLLRDVLQRALPAAATEASASPITPPTPAAPIAPEAVQAAATAAATAAVVAAGPAAITLAPEAAEVIRSGN